MPEAYDPGSMGFFKFVVKDVPVTPMDKLTAILKDPYGSYMRQYYPGSVHAQHATVKA